MENNKSVISVIVPVYNVASYLNQCVRSIVNQTYKDLEIILVDDGSTDGSGTMCDIWKEKDSRIRVIHKLNGGLGEARNVGFMVSKGEFIMYVDSDDWLEVNICEVMLYRIKRSSCDTCMCSYRIVQDSGQVRDIVKYNESRGEICLGRKLLSSIIDGKTKFSYSVWKFMYKRENISDLRFNADTYYEDVLYTTKFLLKNICIAVEPRILYNYRIRNNSITNQKITGKHVKDGCAVIYKQAKLLEKSGYFKDISKYYWLSLLALKYEVYINDKDIVKLQMIQAALRKIPLNRRGLDRKAALKINILRYAMPLYVLYHLSREKWEERM